MRCFKTMSGVFADLSIGKMGLKIFQHMKMYNDENLSPVFIRKLKMSKNIIAWG